MKSLVYILILGCVVFAAIKSGELTGTQSAMVIERKSIYDVAREMGSDVSYKQIENHKAVLLGDTVDYDAASSIRCDELYKYYHIIGYGQIAGSNEMVYLYRLNSTNKFITVPELFAMHSDLKKQGKIK